MLNIYSQNICDVHLPLSRGILTFSRSERIKALLTFFQLNPDFDIICLQELITKSTLKKIQSVLPNHKAIYTPFLNHIKGGLVTFIAKSISIKNYEFKRFTNNFRSIQTIPDNVIQKGIQIIKLEDLTLINSHIVESYNIELALKIQQLQLKEVYAEAQQRKRTIICGDFNTPKRVHKPLFVSFQEAINDELGFTICDENPNRKYIKKIKSVNEQYDNIFVSDDFKISNSKIYNEIQNGEIIISDHFGISTSISLNEPE